MGCLCKSNKNKSKEKEFLELFQTKCNSYQFHLPHHYNFTYSQFFKFNLHNSKLSTKLFTYQKRIPKPIQRNFIKRNNPSKIHKRNSSSVYYPSKK